MSGEQAWALALPTTWIFLKEYNRIGFYWTPQNSDVHPYIRELEGINCTT